MLTSGVTVTRQSGPGELHLEGNVAYRGALGLGGELFQAQKSRGPRCAVAFDGGKQPLRTAHVDLGIRCRAADEVPPAGWGPSSSLGSDHDAVSVCRKLVKEGHGAPCPAQVQELPVRAEHLRLLDHGQHAG